MEKPPILTDGILRELIRPHFADHIEDIRAIAEVQRDADIEWFFRWSEQICKEHHLEIQLFRRRQCLECWQELEKLARG